MARLLYLCDDTQFEKTAALAVERGVGIEVQSFYDPGYYEKTPDAVETHWKAVKDIPHRSFHGPFGDLNGGSFDALVRKIARQRYEEGYQFGTRLNIKRFILHFGYVPHTSPPKYWIPRLVTFWKEFLVDKPSDVRFHLENVLEFDPSMMIDFIDTLADSRVSICLDIGHCHCNSKNSSVEWVRKLGSRIGYAHLHDNCGDDDEHLPLGKGTIDMIGTLQAFQEFAPEALWALESRDHRADLDWLEQNGFM